LSQQNSFATDRLLGLASRAGHAWAAAYTRALEVQRRPIAGAWPGTLTEARARLLAALAHQDLAALSVDELRELARTANHAARDAWRAMAVRDEEL
jgi:hypothetical protein